jgi:DNA-binding IclR family transcriptional regulator
MKKPKRDYAIQTVTNALRVLDAFRGEDEIGVAELSRRLGLHKNNVFRLLATLEEEGYVEQNPTSERYRLGLRTLELGHAFARNHTLTIRVRPVLEMLCRATGETAHLGMLDSFEVVHVGGAAPERALVAAERMGSRLPVHCTALGKVLLGCAPEETRQAYDRAVVAAEALSARTEHTIVDPDKVFDEMRAAAGQGLAFDLEEYEGGLMCVAAPVYASTGLVVAALSVSAPRARCTEEHLKGRLAPKVASAAEELSRELGHQSIS